MNHGGLSAFRCSWFVLLGFLFAFICLVLDKNNICLSITDNGKGFDSNAKFEGIGFFNGFAVDNNPN